MTPEFTFKIVNVAVVPFWLLMIFAPRWNVTLWFMRSHWLIAILPTLYLVLLMPQLGALFEFFSEGLDLTKTAAFLGTKEGCLVGWVHFLAFDFFVGRWIYLTSREERRSSWLMGPILFATLMIGPAGLLAFLILRAITPVRT